MLRYSQKDLEHIQKMYDDAEKNADDNNLYWRNPYRTLLFFIKNVISIQDDVESLEGYGEGVLINDKYVVFPRKWRILGKSKWYFHKGWKHLVDNYINKRK